MLHVNVSIRFCWTNWLIITNGYPKWIYLTFLFSLKVTAYWLFFNWSEVLVLLNFLFTEMSDSYKKGKEFEKEIEKLLRHNGYINVPRVRWEFSHWVFVEWSIMYLKLRCHLGVNRRIGSSAGHSLQVIVLKLFSMCIWRYAATWV